MGGGVLFEDRAQDERRGAGLAGAGRAENGQMLSEQLVDAHHGRNGAVLSDATYAHGARGIAAERRLELALGGHTHAVAQGRIDGDAACKDVRLTRFIAPQLAHEAELRDPDLRISITLGRHRHAQGGNDGQHNGIGGVDAKQRAHVRPVAGANAAFLMAVEQHDRFRAGDRDDAPDRPVGLRNARAGVRRGQLHGLCLTHDARLRSMTASRASVTSRLCWGGRITVTSVPTSFWLLIRSSPP